VKPSSQYLLNSPNISLSATSTSGELFTGPSHTKYVPPHPQKGTRYHRYTLLLLPHADPSAPIDVPQLDPAQRTHFDVRAFAAHYGLDGAAGGGAHMWREVWDEDVSKIYTGRLRECLRPARARARRLTRRRRREGAGVRVPAQARPVRRAQEAEAVPRCLIRLSTLRMLRIIASPAPCLVRVRSIWGHRLPVWLEAQDGIPFDKPQCFT
jgi:hypothetical protein